MDNNITFVLDSGSDYESLFNDWFDYSVRVVPLNLNIDGEEYQDGIDLTKQDFYLKMKEAKELPKTSQPSPAQFHQVFEEEIEKGNSVLYISITSKLSGTYQSAVIAKEMLDDEAAKNVYMIDSENVSAHIILLLKRANQLLLTGMPLEDVISDLEQYRSKVKILAFLDTLENLKKGGRVSLTQATIGGLLNIKPLITITNGLVETIDKFRGRKKGIQYLDVLLNDENKIKETLFVVHSFIDHQQLQDELSMLNLAAYKKIVYLQLGSIIGTHAGMNTLGFVFEEN